MTLQILLRNCLRTSLNKIDCKISPFIIMESEEELLLPGAKYLTKHPE